jgi:hypothetical protein
MNYKTEDINNPLFYESINFVYTGKTYTKKKIVNNTTKGDYEYNIYIKNKVIKLIMITAPDTQNYVTEPTIFQKYYWRLHLLLDESDYTNIRDKRKSDIPDCYSLAYFLKPDDFKKLIINGLLKEMNDSNMPALHACSPAHFRESRIDKILND